MFYGLIFVAILVTSPVLTRNFKQAETVRPCGKQMHQCRDGSCIAFHAVCDGVVDCGDGSDETHALCRGSICQYNWFRCTYGACVDGTAPCNGIQECADNSDELMPRCRNETLETGGRFTCQDGTSIRSSDHCDGVVNCPDGSDETVRSCAQQQCLSYYFQCAYGGCIDHGANCNGTIECADGSDESDELCGTSTDSDTKPIKRGSCILPRNPDHGRYSVVNSPNAGPGQALEFAQIIISCYSGYGVLGNDVLFCYDGFWTHGMPKCVRYCPLNKHPSVNYRCFVNSTNPGLGYRDCNDKELSTTLVKPECSPNYYYSGAIPNMECNDGSWDNVVTCTEGVSKNGTNVTIIVMDKVEIYVSTFQYGGPGNVSVVVPVTESTSIDYDVIDESDWRIGPSSKKNGTTINFNISNSDITVVSNESIVFRDRR